MAGKLAKHQIHFPGFQIRVASKEAQAMGGMDGEDQIGATVWRGGLGGGEISLAVIIKRF